MTERNNQELYATLGVSSLDTLRGVGNAALASLRTEHSRSLEDAERLKAIDALVDLGIVTRLSDMELYHGRAAVRGERWQIDPEFANGGNDSGNHNINARPTLYTGTRDVARRFAEMRSFGRLSSKAEVHQVASLDTDATVLRWSGGELDGMGQYRDAMAVLSPEIIRGTEFAFGISSSDIEAASREVQDILGGANVRLITDNECKGVSGLARQLVARCNTKVFVMESPSWLHTVVNKYLEKEYAIKDERSGESYRIDPSFVAQLARNAHLVGSELPVHSATLDEDIYVVSFFDLYSVDARFNVEHDKRDISGVFGNFSKAIGDRLGGICEPLRSAIMNPYATPKAVMEAAGSMSD